MVKQLLIFLFTLLIAASSFALDKKIEDALLLGDWESVYTELIDTQAVMSEPVLLMLKYKSTIALNKNNCLWYSNYINHQKRYDTAWYNWTKQFVEKNNSNNLANYLIGDACIPLDYDNDVEAYLFKADNLSIDSVLLLLSISSYLNKSFEFEEALEYINMALELKNDFKEGLRLKSHIQHALGEFYYAEKQLKTILEIDSTDCQAIYMLSYYSHQRAFPHLALKEINKVISIYPGNYTYYFMKGTYQASLGLFEKAKKNFEYSLLFKPDYSNTYIGIGNLYAYRTGDLLYEEDTNITKLYFVSNDSAMHYYTKALALDTSNALAYFRLAERYKYISNDSLFFENINKAVQYDLENSYYRFLLAEYYLKQSDTTNALINYKKASLRAGGELNPYTYDIQEKIQDIERKAQ